MYCYKVMPFGLKNIGATYQRIVNKIFKMQIRRNMEVYVDNMIVKTKTTSTHPIDLAETFQTLEGFNMQINLCKCIFRVGFDKFLGYIIH